MEASPEGAAALVPPAVAPAAPPAALVAGAELLLPGVDVFAGEASYYAAKFEGRPTASGEPYRGERLTAAHRTLPFGTRVRVTNLVNGRSVEVRINDRGPFHRRRVIDLSRVAAERLGMVRRGRVPVEVQVLGAVRG
jgi:rare lipoprotein A